MEKQKNSIDNFFREALQDHEIVPSDRAKKAFLKEASEIPQRRWYRGGFFLFLPLAILVIIGGFVIYFIPGKSTEQGPAGIKFESTLPPSEQKTNLPNPVKLIYKNSDNFITQATPIEINKAKLPAHSYQKSEASPKAIESHSDLTQSIPRIDTITNAIDQNKDKIATGEIILPVTNHQPLASDSSIISETSNTSRLISHASYDTIVTRPPLTDLKKGKKQRLNKDWYFSAAIHYTPEWMFNTLEEVKFVNNFGFEGTFTFGKYSIRTGLGLSITKGTNELAVEYNDFLGSYNKLDSISFSWNGSIHNYTPSFHMSTQDVWDSLKKLDYPKIVKRYTYLQIPLILGYDFFQSERFYIGLRAGPLLSVLINSKQLTEDYDPGKKRVIRINNITPGQVSLNWQFMGGINASVRLSENLIFEIEPMAKYYFNSVYEKSEITRKPWSIGIRTAFIIKL